MKLKRKLNMAMTILEVQRLMLSSKTVAEWNDNVDKVKKEFNGYPEWQYKEIVESNIAKAMQMYDDYSIPKHTFLYKELVEKLYHNFNGSFTLKKKEEL